MIKVLLNFCHTSCGKFLRIPGVEVFHLVDEDTQPILFRDVKNVTTEEALDLKPDVCIESVHSLLVKRRKIFNNVPMIFWEHTWPENSESVLVWGKVKRDNSDKRIYIGSATLEAWGEKEDEKSIIIQNCIDLEPYKLWDGSEGFIMTISNLFKQRDWACGYSLWKEVTSSFQNVRLYGFGNGLIENSQGPKNKLDLFDLYKSCGVFLNTSLKSPLPMVCLEAAASSCPIITTNTCELGRVFEDGKNALISDPTDVEQMKRDIDILLTHKDKAKEIGENARKMVEQNFSIETSVEKWKKVLEDIVK